MNTDDLNQIHSGDDFRVQPYCSGDEDHILRLFSRIFPRPRSLKEWSWIYREAPYGSHIMLCWSPAGELMQHYACLVYKAILNGQETRIGNIRDTFASPEYTHFRKAGRRGIAVAAEALFDRWTGPGKIPLCYGFPNLRHFRLGNLIMKYRSFSDWCAFSYVFDQPASFSGRTAATGTITPIQSFDSKFDRLWEERKKKLQFAVCRDSTFLNWRFANHPSRSYVILTYSAYFSDEITGYVVIWLDTDQAYLLDFCFPESIISSRWFWEEVIDTLKWKGIVRINTWLAETSPDLHTLKRLGFCNSMMNYSLVPTFRIFDPQLSTQWCDHNFYFNMSDSDLY